MSVGFFGNFDKDVIDEWWDKSFSLSIISDTFERLGENTMNDATDYVEIEYIYKDKLVGKKRCLPVGVPSIGDLYGKYVVSSIVNCGSMEELVSSPYLGHDAYSNYYITIMSYKVYLERMEKKT